MSTPKKVTPDNSKNTGTENAKSLFKHLAKSAIARGKKLSLVTKLILFAILTAAFVLEHKVGGLMTAQLYMLANDGKLSGRSDGNVYMRNGRIRKMTVPSLVQNTFTQTQRSSLSSLSSSWNALTQDQMNTWNNASGFFASDRFGRPVAIKGKTLYVRLNQNRFNIGLGPILAAPLPTSVPGITDITAVIDDSGNTFILTFTPDPTDVTVTHLVFATAQMSAGTFRPSASKYKLITTIAGGSASPVDINTEYVARLGAPVTGNKIFFKTVPVKIATGQAGIEMVNSAIVVA